MKNNKKHRVYFFDYLWWLGEKEHEKFLFLRLCRYSKASFRSVTTRSFLDVRITLPIASIKFCL